MSELLRQRAFRECERLLQSRERQLVVFVGAGVSRQAGLPDWKGLVESLREDARTCTQPDRDARLQEIEWLVARGRLIDALSALKHALEAASFHEAVARLLGPKFEIPEVVKALIALNPSRIVTTNLDRILEVASAWAPIVYKHYGDLSKHQSVLKIHGTLPEPATWVLTREDYDRVLHGSELVQELRGLYADNIVLFVGYGLEDDDFDQLLSYVRQKSNHGSGLNNFAIMTGVGPWQRSHKLAAAGIQLIEYGKADGKHGEVLEILRALLPALPAHATKAAPVPAPTKKCPWCHESSRNRNRCSRCQRETICPLCDTPIEGLLEPGEDLYECRTQRCKGQLFRHPSTTQAPPPKSGYDQARPGLDPVLTRTAPTPPEQATGQAHGAGVLGSELPQPLPVPAAEPADAPLAGSNLRQNRYANGRLLLESKRAVEATLELQLALKEPGVGPSTADILLALASAQEEASDQSSALRNLMDVAFEEPSRRDEALTRASPLISAATAPAIRPRWEEWRAANHAALDGDLCVALLGARIQLYCDQLREAVALLERHTWQDAGKLRDEAGELAYQLGQRFGAEEARDDALRAYRLALTLRPDHRPSAWSLADWLRVESWSDEAPHVLPSKLNEALEV